MRRLLAFVVPVLVTGENKKPAFSRELHNLFIISEPLEWSAMFDRSALSGEHVKITIKGVKILEKLAKSQSSKVSKFNKTPIKLDFCYDNNSGKDFEIRLDMIYSAFIRATPEQDRNGIDFFLWDLPLQLKSFSHGLTEYVDHVLDNNIKKRGISSVNCTLEELYNWEF